MRPSHFLWLLMVAVATVNTSYCQMVVSGNNTSISGSIVSSLGLDVRNGTGTVDLSNLSLNLVGSSNQTITTAKAITLKDLSMSADTDFSVGGTWTITNSLTLTKGKLLSTSAGTTKMLYTGNNDLVGSDASYVMFALYQKGNTGLRTFPIGDSKGYAPVALQNVTDADKDTELGFNIVGTDPGFNKLPGVADYFTSRFWQFLNGNNGSFSGSQISLSNNGTDAFFSDNKSPTILENDASGTTKDLGGSLNNSFFTSNLPTSTNGRYYAIGKVDEITLKVHKLITPDGDTKNDVLVIDGIDGVSDNEVTILDRWGVPFYKKTNFKNYPDASLPQQDIDYSKMAIGNYVVVVRYADRGVDKSVKQMITVLK